jgi:hypothetical protein
MVWGLSDYGRCVFGSDTTMKNKVARFSHHAFTAAIIQGARACVGGASITDLVVTRAPRKRADQRESGRLDCLAGRSVHWPNVLIVELPFPKASQRHPER